jgi:hypothetical protein
MEQYNIDYISSVYAISKILYYLNNRQEIEIQFDVSPLIDLALATNNKEWFMELTKGSTY